MQKRFVDNIVEMWLLYFFGSLAIAARIYCRTKQVGVRGYHLDDYIVIAVAVSCNILSWSWRHIGRSLDLL